VLGRIVLCGFLLACSEQAVDTVALGDQTFANVCARCHGQDGRGGVPTNGVRPRDLADPAWQGSLGDGQIEAIILGGRGTMPAFKSTLSHDRVQAVVAKVRRLQLQRTAP
jgi:mono/diheme cytochrome c family protein